MTSKNLDNTTPLLTLPDEDRSAAIIYTHSLLAGSMTFIKTQAEAFSRYSPVYVGAHRVDGIDLPEDRTYVVNAGWPMGLVREALFRKWDFAPKLIRSLKKHKPGVVHTHFGTCGPGGHGNSKCPEHPSRGDISWSGCNHERGRRA